MIAMKAGYPEMKGKFGEFVKEVEEKPGYNKPYAFALGLATVVTETDEVLVVDYFRTVNVGTSDGLLAAICDVTGVPTQGMRYLGKDDIDQILDRLSFFVGDGEEHPNIDLLRTLAGAGDNLPEVPLHSRRPVVTMMMPRFASDTSLTALSVEPVDTAEMNLRLTMLSMRLVEPNTINLSGLNRLLPDMAWSEKYGAIKRELLWGVYKELHSEGIELHVKSYGRLPYMTLYVKHQDVRIDDDIQVQLGAYLAPGTTVTREGRVEYNAGTLGACTVEGHISQSVTIDSGTTMKSGSLIIHLPGAKVVIGKNCLFGRKSSVSISLGHDCVVEAGLDIAAETMVTIVDQHGDALGLIKAEKFSGHGALLFRRNTITGGIEAVHRKGQEADLAEVLRHNRSR